MSRKQPLPPLAVLSGQLQRRLQEARASDEEERKQTVVGYMEGQGHHSEGPSIGTAAMFDALPEELTRMRQNVNEQQSRISELLTARPDSASHPHAASLQTHSQSAKLPQIAPFSGKREDQTSTRVKAFVYNIRKVGQIATMTEPDMLALADCYLQDRAATWILGLEHANKKPKTVSDLQVALIREFVPPDEQARAKAKLMKLKLLKTVDGYINQLRELVDICQTPLSEAYLFFFSGLPDDFKEEFTKKYPTGMADNLQDVYKHARTIEMASQWNIVSAKRKKAHSSRSNDGNSTNTGNEKRDRPTPKRSERHLDKEALSWGPV